MLTLHWLVSQARADSAPELTLSEVLASVERSFPQIRMAELEQSMADAELLSAEGGFDNIREQQTAEARLRLVDALLDYQRGRVALHAARGETQHLP